MPLRKHGVGEVLSEEDEEQRKTAKTNWTEKDEQELVAELGDE